MKINSINVHPGIYRPNESNTLKGIPNLKDSNSTNAQFKFGKINHAKFNPLDLSSIKPRNDLIDNGAIKDAEPQKEVRANNTSLQNGTDHGFLTKSLDFIINKAKGYANYLNPEVFKDEDISKSPYYENNKMYDKAMKAIARDYAKGAIEFFGMKEANNEEIDELTTQFATLIKEYGTLLAKDSNTTTADLQTKLTINGVDLTFDELDITTKAMNTINKNLDNPSMTKHVNFAQLGLGVTQMKYIARKYLSEEAGDMVMATYNERVKNNIVEHNRILDLSNDFRKKLSRGLEKRIGIKLSELPQKDDVYCDPYYRIDTKFEDSGKKDIMKWFASIDVTNIDTIKSGFENSIEKFNAFQEEWTTQRQSGLSSNEKMINDLLINKSYTEFFNIF